MSPCLAWSFLLLCHESCQGTYKCKAGSVTAIVVVLGLAIVLFTAVAMIATVVMPRGRSVPQLLGGSVTKVVRIIMIKVSKVFTDFAKKDAVLATIGPLAMLAQLL